MQYGLLGEHLSHSYSPTLHALLADYTYQLFPTAPADLDAFLTLGKFQGLNVTIPYKTAVIPYCQSLSETARTIGSVNTLVRRADGTLHGDNTDAEGFSALILKSAVCLGGKKVLVLGSGGASRTVCAVLAQEAVREVVVISRQGANNYENLSLHADADCIVNTTPLGMYPHNGKAPLDLTQFPQCKAVFDLIYNPARTALMLQAERLGMPSFGGLWMLLCQAKGAVERFTGKAIPEVRLQTAWVSLQKNSENLILIGMPSSGKSTLGKALAEHLGRDFVDSDACIVARQGREIPEIFAEEGEEAFRRYEHEVIADLGKGTGLVIATGGGVVTRPENYAPLHQNGRLLWVRRDLEKLSTEGRPLSQQNHLETLYAQRKAQYEAFADAQIDNNGDLAESIQKALEVWFL